MAIKKVSKKKKPGPKKGEGGVERKDFDWELLDNLCAHTMWLKDCAELMKLSEDTIQRRIKEKYGITFAVYRDKKLAKTRMSLVQRALKMAATDRVMLIFCLKNLNKWQDQITPDPEPIEDVEFNQGMQLSWLQYRTVTAKVASSNLVIPANNDLSHVDEWLNFPDPWWPEEEDEDKCPVQEEPTSRAIS